MLAAAVTHKPRNLGRTPLDLVSLVYAPSLTVQGKDIGELMRAEYIRQGFMGALMADPAVQRSLSAIATASGIELAAREALDAGYELAERVGLDGPHGLFVEGVFDEDSPIPWLKDLGRDEDAELLARWIAAVNALDELLDAEKIAQPVFAVIVFGLQLPWPWVVREVTHAFVGQWISTAMGLDLTITRRIELDQPVGVKNIRVRAGETPKDILARVRRSLGLGGRKPDEKRERLAEYGAWLYRHKVLRISKRALATEYTRKHRGVEQSDDRPTVKYGIELAARLLNQGQPVLELSQPLPQGASKSFEAVWSRISALRTPPGELATPR
jgi:hypothetical protein